MEKIYTSQTWIIFVYLLLPGIFPDNKFGVCLLVIWLAISAFCVYSLGNDLSKRLPIDSPLTVKKFNYFLLFMIIYMAVINLFYPGGYSINQDNYKEFGLAIYIVIPFHLFFFYCLFYTIWFIAKSIASIENKKDVGFEYYIRNILLLFFLPIGIWWMHPKINRIFLEEHIETFLE